MNKKDELCQVENKIKDLEIEKYNLKNEIFAEHKKNGWFGLLHAQYESSASRTPQYLTFHQTFKREFTKMLKENFNVKKVQIGNPNHFDATGFFELQDGNIIYFSIGDLRWHKNFLIRTADSFTDYYGHSNNYLSIESYEQFLTDLTFFIKKTSEFCTN